MVHVADVQIIQSVLALGGQIALQHGAGQQDHGVDDGGSYAVLLAQLAHQVAAHGHILGDVAVLQIEGTVAVEVLVLLGEGHCEVGAHVLLAVHGGTGEEVLIVHGAQTHFHLGSQGLLFLPELGLNLGDSRAQSEAVQGVVLLILTQNGIEVLHHGSTQNGAGNVDNGVDVGQVDVQHGVAAHEAVVELLALLGDGNFAVSIHDSTESGNVPGGSHESVGVGVGQSAATDSGDTVFHLALVGDDAAAAHDTDAIGSGVPGTNDDLLGAVHLTHQLAEYEGAAVIRQDVNHLTVFQQRNQLTENCLMTQSDSGNDDDACALDSLCQIVGSQSNVCDASALVAEEAELVAAQGNAGLFNVEEIGLSKSRLIPQANFLSRQCTVRSHRLAYCAAAPNRDRHVLQITHIHF